jgi:O-antigen ligase
MHDVGDAFATVALSAAEHRIHRSTSCIESGLMFALPATIALITFIYARPQEFFDSLQAAPLLYIIFGLTLFGAALDLRLGNTKLRPTPQLPWIAAFAIWCIVTALVRAPRTAMPHIQQLAIAVALYLVIAHGVQTFRALQAVAGVILAMVLFVCAVGVHQAYAPKECVLVDDSAAGDTAANKPDGRPCSAKLECYSGEPQPGAEYLCEHVGLLGTTSVEERIRYRGVLQDPNELALAGGIGLPLAFAFRQHRRKSWLRALVIALTLAFVLACAVLTRSRTGQVVCLAVLAVYFVKRFGVRGFLPGCLLALPVLLLGGRSGEEASSSTMERIDCWAEALSMFRSHPVFGVGLGQFGEYHNLTAHNSYLLALAELGFPGMLLFSVVVYLSVKIPVRALRRIASGDPAFAEGADTVRPWATAMLAAFAGLGVGMFFLSLAYHYVFWLYLGLTGALYSAIRTHDPAFRVRLRWSELAVIGMADCALIGLVHFYTRWKLG